MKTKHIVYTSLGIAALLLAVYFVPVQVAYTIDATGVVVPASEWTLRFTNNTGVQSVLRDNCSGTVLQSSVYEIDRGDAVHMRFARDIAVRDRVERGDTVCMIASSLLAVTLAEKLGELEVAEKELPVVETGEKQSVVQAAKDKLQHAEQQAALQRLKFKRVRQLHEKELISDEEYENSRDELKLLEINAGVAKAELEAATTGMKPEEIALKQANIDAIRKEIAALQLHAHLQYQVAPISGYLIRPSGEDTLLQVLETDRPGLQAAVVASDVRFVQNGMRVRFKDQNGLQRYGKVLRIDRFPRSWGRRQAYIAYAEWSGTDASQLWNRTVDCTIECGSVRLGEYLTRHVKGALGLE